MIKNIFLHFIYSYFYDFYKFNTIVTHINSFIRVKYKAFIISLFFPLFL